MKEKKHTEEQIEQLVEILTKRIIACTDMEKHLITEYEQKFISSNKAKIKAKQAVKEFKKKFAEDLGWSKDAQCLRRGLSVLAEEISKFASHDPVAINFMGALKHKEEQETTSPATRKSEEIELQVYENWLEWLGLTQETLQACYSIGLQKLYDDQIDDAWGIFFFLTHCNPFIFEPWLCLGLCQEKQEAYSQATYSYFMAIVNNPASSHAFLRCAISHAKLGNRRDAEENLKFAENRKKEWTGVEIRDYEELTKIL